MQPGVVSLAMAGETRILLVRRYLLDLQMRICAAMEKLDNGQAFIVDQWQHHRGGGGLTRVLRNGKVFEQAGVNFSHVVGESLPAAASARKPELAGRPFEATGVSLVIHPRNPFVPTTHMNVRFFSTTDEDRAEWWFGGGFDLTPYYGNENDVRHWHRTARQACERISVDYYPRFKRWCDEYFYLKHRDEQRGVGGLFFDDFNEKDFSHSFAFMQSVGEHFLPAYTPIVEQRKSQPFTDRHRSFQCYRRGRYVEFNLVYDRGTLFGLQSGGRTESILMSLPPVVHWQYNWQAERGSDEERLTDYFLKPRNWI